MTTPAPPTAWLTEDSPDVRLYAVTGGRTMPRHTMHPESLLAPGPTAPPTGLGPEARRTLDLCRTEQRSVAEIAGTLGLPLHVTKIVVSDLLDSGALIITVADVSAHPDAQILREILDGLRRKWPDAA